MNQPAWVVWNTTNAWGDLAQLLIVNGRACLLLLMGLLLLRCFKAPASYRHLFITLVLGASLLMPVSYQLLPPVEIVIDVPLPVQSDAPVSSEHGQATPHTVSASRHSSSVIPPSWPAWLLGFYMIGMGALFARIVWSNLVIVAFAYTATPCCTARWQKLLRQCSVQLWVRKPVEVRYSKHIHSPMTFGFFNPVILIPGEALFWSEEVVRSTLLHELAHIKRADWLIQQFSRGVCALYWINPFSWWALRQLNDLAEVAADDAAVNSGLSKSTYAEHLLQVAERLKTRHSLDYAAVSMAVAPNQLTRRIGAILSPGNAHSPLSIPVVVLILVSVLGFLVPLSSVHAQFKQRIATPLEAEPPVSTIADRQLPEFNRSGPTDEAVRTVINDLNSLFPVAVEGPAPEFTPPLGPAATAFPPSKDSGAEKQDTRQAEKSDDELVDITATQALALAGNRFKEKVTAMHAPSSNASGQPNAESSSKVSGETAETRPLENAASEPERQAEKEPQSQSEQLAEAPSTSASRPRSFMEVIVAQIKKQQLKSNALAQVVNNRIPAVRRLTKPAYPEKALRRGIEGKVTVEYDVDAQGNVTQARIIQASPKGIFDKVVIQALKQSEFIPPHEDGRPVAAKGLQEVYQFILES